MKRITLIAFAIVATMSSLVAQNYMIVDSKKIFESMAEYNNALTTIENLAKSYQSEVDAKFDNVENLYDSYMQRQASLNSTERMVYEQKIANLEAQATEYQESIFAMDGVLMKRRLELLSPIQERVFSAIESYAKARGYDLVLDESSSSTILYRSQSIEHTNGIIEQLK